MGPNIQWDWFPSKGKGIICSQNPLCYKAGSSVDILSQFERENPGLKKILTSPSDSAKVVDLTNSYTYTDVNPFDPEALKNRGIQYIFNSPDLRKVLSAESLVSLSGYDVVLVNEENSILRVE